MMALISVMRFSEKETRSMSQIVENTCCEKHFDCRSQNAKSSQSSSSIASGLNMTKPRDQAGTRKYVCASKNFVAGRKKAFPGQKPAN